MAPCEHTEMEETGQKACVEPAYGDSRSVMHKLKHKLGRIFGWKTGPLNEPVIETDFLKPAALPAASRGGSSASPGGTDVPGLPGTPERLMQQEDGKTNKGFQGTLDKKMLDQLNASSPPSSFTYGTFEDDAPDETSCRKVSNLLQDHLYNSKEARLDCDLVLPPELLARISHDIMVMSQCEPCGIRGCLLIVNLERPKLCVRLGRLAFDPDTVSTFELHLTLLEENTKWTGLFRLFRSLLIPCMQPAFREKVLISPGFKIVKKKLYKSS